MARRDSPSCRVLWSLVVAVASFLGTGEAGLARAQDRAGLESLNPPRGSLVVSAALEVGMDMRFRGAPVALAPDAYVGVTRRFTVGVIHSGQALGLLNSGWGLCLTGPRKRCDRVVSGTGLDGWYTFLRVRHFELAGRTRLYAARYGGPVKVRMTLGLWGLVRAGPVALRFEPHISLGLSNRELGNGDAFNVPIHLFVGIGRYVAVYVRTGVRGLLRSFSDQYAIPLGLGVVVRPTTNFRLGAQFVFRRLMGPLNTHKKRDLLFTADYRFTSFF